MMKSLFLTKSRLSFYFILLLAVSCKVDRSIDEENENLQAVNFKVSGFSTAVLPLKSSSVASNAVASNTQNYVEGNLYFWSFNSETREPDIAYQTVIKPSISFNKGVSLNQTPKDFPNSNYTFGDYIGGSAVSITGASEIFIKFPIAEVEKITQFGFDTGSSGTGPKDFELYYSVDEGQNYVELALNNQFAYTGEGSPPPKNTYIYHLSDKNIVANNLWFKFIPKAGDRGAAGNFNPTSGAWRFDNIRLIGLAASTNTGGNNPINKLHYFLFHKDKPEVVVSGSTTFQTASDLTLNMPLGKYQVCFVSNNSAKELILPDDPTVSSFYVSNTFSNANAEIFGYTGEIEVTGAMEHAITLQRLFSQVKLEFTDAIDLSSIKRIEISQQHDPLFFAPFNSSLSNPVLDQTDIVVTSDFNANKQLVFNQFIGVKSAEVPLNYQVTLFSDQGVIRTFALQSAVKNNVQLVFRGNILESIDPSRKFQIQKNMDWGEHKTGTF